MSTARYIANPVDDPVKSELVDANGNRATITRGNLNTLAADQATQPIDSYFAQSISNFTIAADVTVSTISST
jgi:hypothetical protein